MIATSSGVMSAVSCEGDHAGQGVVNASARPGFPKALNGRDGSLKDH